MHASVLSRLGFVDVCRIGASNLWKIAQLSDVPSSHETESGGGASEHTAVSAVDRISFDAAIARLSNHGEADELGGEFLAAAIALRDSSGRDRLSALRNIAGIHRPSSGSSVSGKTTAITITSITSITITVIHQLLTHLLTSSFSFFLFIIIAIVTAIEHLDSRGGLRALERRRACDGVFVMGTCAQRSP